MPLREYRCVDCGTVIEHLEMGSDAPPGRCEECGGRMERVFSLPGLIQTGTRRTPGRTCCGREERCEKPPCSDDGTCSR